jgi:hypothetical protein
MAPTREGKADARISCQFMCSGDYSAVPGLLLGLTGCRGCRCGNVQLMWLQVRTRTQDVLARQKV